ncbi:MAG: hypothetical protein AUJ92_09730 [Armatimonadetes bacterium CG2_30_59_28]|nr:MAG: hypothetical protein AUJ92_09730 [Armatimonadetes bacterium CG2_30_59_28]
MGQPLGYPVFPQTFLAVPIEPHEPRAFPFLDVRPIAFDRGIIQQPDLALDGVPASVSLVCDDLASSVPEQGNATQVIRPTGLRVALLTDMRHAFHRPVSALRRVSLGLQAQHSSKPNATNTEIIVETNIPAVRDEPNPSRPQTIANLINTTSVSRDATRITSDNKGTLRVGDGIIDESLKLQSSFIGLLPLAVPPGHNHVVHLAGLLDVSALGLFVLRVCTDAQQSVTGSRLIYCPGGLSANGIKEIAQAGHGVPPLSCLYRHQSAIIRHQASSAKSGSLGGTPTRK